jgi:hypothetical protein
MDLLYQALVSRFPDYEFKHFSDLGVIIVKLGENKYRVMQYNSEIKKITIIKTIEIISQYPHPQEYTILINKVIIIHFNHWGINSRGEKIQICRHPSNYITNTHFMNITDNSFFTCNKQYYDENGNLIKPIPHKLIMPSLSNDMNYYFVKQENILQLTSHAVLPMGCYAEGTWTAGETSKYGFNIKTFCHNGEEYIMILTVGGQQLTYLVSEKECILTPRVFGNGKEFASIIQTATETTLLFSEYILFYDDGNPYDQYDVYRLGDDYFTYYQGKYAKLIARKPNAGKHTKIAIRTD